mmetsp:Transcript_119646/g.335077  ORF Transcript_119646/g.335077 Transcript_119646/m.335077 type:complete len:209 (+) Transcript_119646:259-885(+)
MVRKRQPTGAASYGRRRADPRRLRRRRPVHRWPKWNAGHRAIRRIPGLDPYLRLRLDGLPGGLRRPDRRRGLGGRSPRHELLVGASDAVELVVAIGLDLARRDGLVVARLHAVKQLEAVALVDDAAARVASRDVSRRLRGSLRPRCARRRELLPGPWDRRADVAQGDGLRVAARRRPGRQSRGQEACDEAAAPLLHHDRLLRLRVYPR